LWTIGYVAKHSLHFPGVHPMSTTPQNSPQKARKRRRSSPRKSVGRIPSEADREAHRLYSEGMKQDEIAVKQQCTQPTVSRRIWRTQKWIAADWPDRQGELTVSEACRVSVVEHG